jgi:hypothetical protein
MKTPVTQLSTPSSQVPARLEEQTGREFQELWFALGRRDWRSVVLVPADPEGSTAAMATSLAKVGRQLHELPVTLFVMSKPADYWPAVQIVNSAASADPGAASPDEPDYATSVRVVAAAASGGRDGKRFETGKVIIAIQPVVSEPLGLAVTQVADTVVLRVELGRTRLDAVRRTIELIGRERIAGCFLDSPSGRLPNPA